MFLLLMLLFSLNVYAMGSRGFASTTTDADAVLVFVVVVADVADVVDVVDVADVPDDAHAVDELGILAAVLDFSKRT